MDVEEGGVRTRVWRLPPEELEIDVPLLIADGHHRYETAVAFREEDPSATHTFAVLVSSRSPGLEIFPTHRVAQLARRRAATGSMTSTLGPRRRSRSTAAASSSGVDRTTTSSTRARSSGSSRRA